MSILAQASGSEAPEIGLTDNEVLDEYFVPFGSWVEHSVDWSQVHLRWLLDIIEWPFRTGNDVLVNDIMLPMTWVGVVAAFFVIGTLLRGLRVGVFAAVSIAVCGFLGDDFWRPTVDTISFVLVAVIMCVVVGLPLGIACGRMDGLWQVVRPVLDAMQVVHAFVYMIPFITWFGTGPVGATIVTMFFAIPPLVRLTNLGVRQVPEDVVEASRSYGAPEWRVLFDVQIPLARPAIMTGLNQTILLAVSMLGIAAIMGAGGLGQLLFGAISSQDVKQSVPPGLAFFLVAVVYDRISQSSAGAGGGLLRRIRLAWAHRRDPEELMTGADADQADADQPEQGIIAPLTQGERRPMVLAGAGGLVAALSVLLTWSADSGFLSAYGRRSDEGRNLVGESFNGLSASGGSWFGILVAVLGLFIVASVAKTLLSAGGGPRGLAVDGAVVASLALLVATATYLLAAPSDFVQSTSTPIGPWVALVGALVATAGSLLWIRSAPHAAARPLPSGVRRGGVFAGVFAAVVLAVGAISAWSFDERAEVVVPLDVQAQLDDLALEEEALRAREATNPEDAGIIAVDASRIAAERDALLEPLKAEGRIIVDGISGKGPGLGIWVVLAGLVGLGAALPAAGVFGRDDLRQWRWSSVSAGVGAGVACVGLGWIFTQIRSADPDYVSGIGSFLAVAGGLVLVAGVAPVLSEFSRAKVYAADEALELEGAQS